MEGGWGDKIEEYFFLLIMHPVWVGESSNHTSKPEFTQTSLHAIGSHKGAKITVRFSSSQTSILLQVGRAFQNTVAQIHRDLLRLLSFPEAIQNIYYFVFSSNWKRVRKRNEVH